MSHRILESVHLDKEEAEAARQGIIKRYAHAPQLCTDTETDTFTVEVWVATRTKAYGCSGEDPETTVLAVGTRDQCLVEAQAEVVRLMPTVTQFGDEGVETEDGWRGVDGENDVVYTVQLHKAP
jgi:hypothetical protein